MSVLVMPYLQIHERDNVLVALADIRENTTISHGGSQILVKENIVKILKN